MSSRVLLLFPPSRTHYAVPPLGLGYLATALRRRGFTVEILDAVRERLSPAEVERRIAAAPPAMVGIQTFSYDVPAVRDLTDRIRRVAPAVPIVIGGAHPSGSPETVLDDIPSTNFAVQGEGEEALPLLAGRLLPGEPIALEEVPGLIYRTAAGVRRNPPRVVDDLDTLGFPAWDLMDPRQYRGAPQGVFVQAPPVAPISTSRGCPYLCGYCAGSTISGRRLRYRSIPHVLGEIDLLVRDFGVREVHIVDDNATAVRERIFALCAGLALRRHPVRLAFPNGVRLDTLDAEILGELRRAGCHSLIVGIESGSDRVLRLMQKGLTTAAIRKGVELIRGAGIHAAGFFILGYPGETPEEARETIRFARSLNLTAAHFSNFLPLPGTAATQRLRAEGRLGELDWSSLFYARTPYQPDGFRPGELKRLQRRAYLTFYLRPQVLWGLRGSVRSIAQMLAILRRLRDYLGAW